MTVLRQINQAAILAVVAVIGGCIAAYAIEDRRIGEFCKSLSPGTPASSANAKADAMFGAKIWKQRKSDNFVVKSRFTYKTLCMVSVTNGLVTDASFSND